MLAERLRRAGEATFFARAYKLVGATPAEKALKDIFIHIETRL